METLGNFCEWRHSPVFPDEYLVSNDGRVFSVRNCKEIAPSSDRDGYLYYVLCVSGVRKTIKAHRLVASAFIPNPDCKPTVDHINANIKDNRVENLRWATHKEQMKNPVTHAKRMETARTVGIKNKGKESKNKKPVIAYKNGIYHSEYRSATEASNSLHINLGKISMCANRKRKQTGGYTFCWKTSQEEAIEPWR